MFRFDPNMGNVLGSAICEGHITTPHVCLLCFTLAPSAYKHQILTLVYYMALAPAPLFMHSSIFEGLLRIRLRINDGLGLQRP